MTGIFILVVIGALVCATTIEDERSSHQTATVILAVAAALSTGICLYWLILGIPFGHTPSFKLAPLFAVSLICAVLARGTRVVWIREYGSTPAK